MNSNKNDSVGYSRREFVSRATAVGAGVFAALGVPNVFAAGSDTIRVGMIGCGGRCTEAAQQAMNADKGVRLVAMADIVRGRLLEKRTLLRQSHPEQAMVDDDHCFTGFDA